MGKVYLIASGKGGVGKSTVAASLGAALSDTGREVCVVDADIGLRDQDALLGLENHIVYDLLDVAAGGCQLNAALIAAPGRPKLWLLAASQFARAKELAPKDFAKVVRQLRSRFDFTLIDCPAGIERSLRGLLGCGADAALVVTTPDNVCLRDAERLVGVLRDKKITDIRLIVNRLSPGLVRTGEIQSAEAISALLEVPLWGEIPEDEMVYRAMINRHLLVDVDSDARDACLRIARRLAGDEVPLPRLGQEKRGLLARLFGSKPKEVRVIDR